MSKTILVADDSATIRKVVELAFQHESVREQQYEVVAVGSGDAAMAQLGAVSPAAVICDVHLPMPNGYEVARQSKARDPEVPVLLLIGTFEEFDSEAFVECGADAYLKKPFDTTHLLELVRHLLAGGSADTFVPSRQPGLLAWLRKGLRRLWKASETS